MYLYLGIFNDTILENKRCSISNSFFESIKRVFPNYKDLNSSPIEGCIAFKFYKNYDEDNALFLEDVIVKGFDKFINIEFGNYKQINVTNGQIKKSIYRFACVNNWIDKDNKYYPILCIVNKPDFNLIRKGTPDITKTRSNNAQIDEMKSNNDWKGICELYEPLEKINESEIWNNAADLYNIAYACSKMGEVKNGFEKDNYHLKFIKRYRDLAVYLYSRCNTIDPYNHAYCSALAYRYYLNVSELTKAKGRRDGKVKEEIENALIWFNKTLELKPESIKDNYRKGKLIIDKQINNFRYSEVRKWRKEEFEKLNTLETEGTESLNKAINVYEKITSKAEKERNFNEYNKAIYNLGCFYVDKPQNYINEYLLSKIRGQSSEGEISANDIKCYIKAKELFDKCLYINMKMPEVSEINIKNINLNDYPVISPIDIFYHIGCVSLNLYCINKLLNADKNKIEACRLNAEKYLLLSYNLSLQLKHNGKLSRDTWFINDKLALCYILENKNNDAIKIIEKARASYIKNTLAAALILTGSKDNIEKAKIKLNEALNDKWNKANKFTELLLKQIDVNN